MSEYESLWGSELLSDVEVVLFEDADEPGTKRKQEVTIGCHRLVLACNSDYFKAQVVNWSSTVQDPESSTQSQSSSKPQIRMAVPAGRLELGQLLLKSMYQVKPDLADLQQELWLPLLMLADKYAVSKVITALCISFRDAYSKLDWKVVADFYRLPDVISNSQQCRTIHDAVANKLQLELGDLELVWGSEEKRTLLLQLPYGAIKRLLVSDVTKVASENTAAYTVMQWAAAQPATSSLQQQLQQLCSLLRMRHCSQLFIATVFSTDAKISSCLSPYEWQIAALYSSQHGLNLNNDIVKQYPAWRQSMRPRSACTFHTIDCRVKLATLEQLYKQCLSSKAKTRMISEPSKFWQGRSLALGFQLLPTERPVAPSTDTATAAALPPFSKVGLEVQLVLKGGVRQLARVKYSLKMSAIDGKVAPASCRLPALGGNVVHNMSGNAVFGHRMMHMPSSSWADAEACLRNVHLVHSDSCVVFSANIIHIE